MFKEKGFTLIELVIAVAIVAVLAAIAYPSYQDSVRKSRRADARAVLLEAAQFMERFYTENNRYNPDRGGTDVALPTSLTTSPKEGATKYYNISLRPGCNPPPFVSGEITANTFTLYACPISPQNSDKCGTLTLTNTGLKGQATGQTVDNCWR